MLIVGCIILGFVVLILSCLIWGCLMIAGREYKKVLNELRSSNK